jgi:hypothetical protein
MEKTKEFISNNWGIMLFIILSFALYYTWGTWVMLILFPFWCIAPACKN